MSEGSWLISYFGISSAVGRMLFGRISDVCSSFKNISIYRTCMFLSGLASVLCPLASSYWALVLYVVVLGILDGSYIGLMSIVTLDIVGVQKIASAWGILFFCQSFTYLLGPPAAGKGSREVMFFDNRHFHGFWCRGHLGFGGINTLS